LHWALRSVLGEHVKQAGSLVSPDRLRFDFSHYEAVTPEEIEKIETLANAQVLLNAPVTATESSKDEALAAGAIAFFGDKYGDVVRVLRAGASTELCGGTHVTATGDIGTIKIIGESSIGSNLRRIEAVTGVNAVRYMQRNDAIVTEIAQVVGTRSEDAVAGVQKKMDDLKAAQDEIKALRAKLAIGRASEIAESAENGLVVYRVDGMAANDVRDLALAVRQNSGVRIVVLGGITDTGGVSLVAALKSDVSANAGDIIKDAARAVGGGGGGKGDIATAGGKNPEALDDALQIARNAARVVLDSAK
jgi:alanyl-tRNA synthetase